MKRAILGLLASCLLSAQTPDPAVTFEVASIKVSPPPQAITGSGGMRVAQRIGCTGGPGTPSPGQFTCTNANITVLIREAFTLKNYQVPTRFVFLEPENQRAKLMSFARNDKLFTGGEDLTQLALETRYVIGGAGDAPNKFRVIVLRGDWLKKPWDDLDPAEHPDQWDDRIPILVLPEEPDDFHARLGEWLKTHVPRRRNTLRFLIPKAGSQNAFLDRDLIILARAIVKADEWRKEDSEYGINLQVARILFNFDLPWNPMDLEQRIGRIHRYGQLHTAQVYNLVLSDTIEGRIFLLLNDKLHEIARALGKVDEQGNVAEDLRAQILGQLSERLNYDRLYQEALSDPELKRTRLELEAAVGNAEEARRVVFDLFQDLDDFRLDDFKPFSDVESSLARLIRFLTAAMEDSGHRVRANEKNVYEIEFADGRKLKFTTDRELGKDRQDLELMGLDHPLAQELLSRYKRVPAEAIGVAVQADDTTAGVVSLWFVESHGKAGERKGNVQAMAVDLDGQRLPHLERAVEKVFHQAPAEPTLSLDTRLAVLKKDLEPMLYRDLQHRGVVTDGMGFSSELIGWIEVNLSVPSQTLA